MKKRTILALVFVIIILCFVFDLLNDKTETTSTTVDNEVAVFVSVQRTGNILSNIGDLEIWIDDEKVFSVDGNSTNSAVIVMPVGTHTIQAKGQGDKSKKIKFDVVDDDENTFYFTAEISNWFGIKLEKRKYMPISIN